MARYGKGVSKGRTQKSTSSYHQRIQDNSRLEVARAMYERDFFEGMEMDYETVCFGNDYFRESIKKSVLEQEMQKATLSIGTGNISGLDGRKEVV